MKSLLSTLLILGCLVAVSLAEDCDEVCQKFLSEAESLKAQLESASPGKESKKQVGLVMQSLKIALKTALVPTNTVTGGSVFVVLDKVIPTEKNIFEQVLNLSDPKELTAMLIDQAMDIGVHKELYELWGTVKG